MRGQRSVYRMSPACCTCRRRVRLQMAQGVCAGKEAHCCRAAADIGRAKCALVAEEMFIDDGNETVKLHQGILERRGCEQDLEKALVASRSFFARIDAPCL